MQLNPRYGDDPVITLDGSNAEILQPTLRQRRRLATSLESFTDEDWKHPSRCAGWSNRDVVIHLESTNSFWAYSIDAGRRGDPTRFLATFDPVMSPAELVAGAADVSFDVVLERFVASNDALEAVLSSLDDRDWVTMAEAPPGHLPISAVAHHALWDSWVHERDIMLPLGRIPDAEADELAAVLRYVAALGPALALNRATMAGETMAGGTVAGETVAGETVARGVLIIDATEPDLSVVVEIGDRVRVRSGPDGNADLRLTGDAVELIESLSLRQPLDQPVSQASWMLTGLAESFDSRSSDS